LTAPKLTFFPLLPTNLNSERRLTFQIGSFSNPTKHKKLKEIQSTKINKCTVFCVRNTHTFKHYPVNLFTFLGVVTESNVHFRKEI
jgi:hypothetical protein